VGRDTVSKSSIYRSPGGEAEIMAAYDDALIRLGLRCETRVVGTHFGETHVLLMGPEGASPILFLHGGNVLNPFCLSWFAPLAESYRLYAPDIVGQPGKSSQIRPSPQGDGHAQWTVDVMDALDLGRVPFVGVSYGAGITLRVAGYAPERISKTALVSPSAVATGTAWRMVRKVMIPTLSYMVSPNRERLLRAARPILTELEEPFVRQLGAIYRNVRLDTHLPRMATTEELAAFEAPTLVFACDEDVFFPGEAVAKRAREIVPNLAGVEVLEGSRHIPSRRALEYVNAKIVDHLRIY
jgi:pimeloyl-ACP methyl ester carboxylesterase